MDRKPSVNLFKVVNVDEDDSTGFKACNKEIIIPISSFLLCDLILNLCSLSWRGTIDFGQEFARVAKIRVWAFVLVEIWILFELIKFTENFAVEGGRLDGDDVHGSDLLG